MKLKIGTATDWARRKLNSITIRYMVWRAERAAARRVAAVKRQYPGCEGAMNATWPPVSGTTTGYKITGTTTIRWGTDGLMQTPAPGGGGFYVVLRCDQKELVENIKLPNGSGITSARVRLRDGVHWAITIRDDTQLTGPVVGDSIGMQDGAGMLGLTTLYYTGTLVESDYNAALKQPGERVLLVEKLTLVDTAAGGTAG